MRIRREDIPRLKGLIMFGLGLPVAALGAVTGIGVQVAAQPMIRFLLGLTPERALGTAVAFGLVASAAGLIGAAVGGIGSDLTLSLILAISATIGALLTVKLVADPRLVTMRRVAQSVAMILGIYLLSGVMRSRFGPAPIDVEFFRTTPGHVAIGVAAG